MRAVMTRSARRFIGPSTLSGLLGEPPLTDLWSSPSGGEPHVELGAWADAIIVSPATMNLLAQAAAGFADDALLATLACRRGALVLAPAMHYRMWQQPSTQQNVALLRERGATIVGPVVGPLASGEQGEGRMAEPEEIAAAAEQLFCERDLEGRRLVITAGPTYEDLDPVRFLGNRSSGRMGLAIAERAAARGAQVELVLGPTALDAPRGVHVLHVRSALQMHDAVLERALHADAVVMAAAVADYRPAERLPQKRKKTPGELDLRLVANPDILAELGAARSSRRPILIGFALETESLIEAAREKLQRKKVDLIVANRAQDALESPTNQVIFVSAAGEEAIPAMRKLEVADRLLDRLQDLLHG